MSESAPFLTSKEVALRWKMSPQTLANWRASGGKGPPHIKIGNKVLYPIEGIHAFEKINQSWLATSASQEDSAAIPRCVI
jgi:hypothetical protein